MRLMLCVFILIIFTSCSDEKKLPVLTTTSKVVSVKDGNTLHKNVWSVSSEVQIDEFITKQFKGEKNVSFISDIDTITFSVMPNNTYDFIIKYNDEQAFTRINTNNTKKASIQILEFYYDNKERKSDTDTIPFVLGSDHRIHIKGSLNGSDSLDFLFDTGANAIVINSNLIGNKVNLMIDGQTENKGSDGMHKTETSSSNRLNIGHLNWDDVNLLSINYKNPNFDGVLGWVAFENKIVEIDYEKNRLIIHKSMKTVPKDYSKIETKMIGRIPYIRGTVIVDSNEIIGWFEYDSGSNGSISMSQKYASDNNLKGALKKVGTSITTGSAGIEFTSTEHILPKIKFGEFEVSNLPLSIKEKDPEGVSYNDILGNNLLKRFNAILDFQNHQVYLKPNSLLHSGY